MSSAGPTIPPRPTRSGPASLDPQDTPLIPPRPHRTDRSPSPNREAYTRSPLNELPPSSQQPIPAYAQHHPNISASDLPDRPPSVQLPSIGQEGDEYASLSRTQSEIEGLQRNVAADLPMHQPTASIPQATAKSRIETVTGTESSQPSPVTGPKILADDDNTERRSLRPRASFNRSNTSLTMTSRPGSIHDPDPIGIPEIGVQVPMYPNAGDVQAPSPAPVATPHAPGIGYFNDGSQRHHHRRRSSRHDLNPPGSYGMHGHGVEPRDHFEKAWYQRHPEELAKEMRHPYDPGHPRSEWALSSEQLNQLVHGSTDRGLPPSEIPDEQIGYEQYSGPKPSQRPVPLAFTQKRPSNGSMTHIESPLRKSSFPANERHHNDDAVESDDEDQSKPHRHPKTGSSSSHERTIEFGRDPYDVPILASDEVAKYGGKEHHKAAVEYEERKNEDHYSGYDSDHHQSRPERHGGSHHGRPSSRPSSAHGEPLARLISHDRHDGSGVGTPLHEIQEYEPLFPDDDDKVVKPKSKQLHRPDLARHHFPSRDVWEDNPDSLGLTATVSTPDLPLEPREESEDPATKAFETPEDEAARKNGPTSEDRADFLTAETERFAQPRFKPGVRHEIAFRPGMQPRFPSQDIWEDTPDSMRLETTVSTPQSEEEPSAPKPIVPNRPAGRTRSDASDKTGSPPMERKAPVVPGRPKPTVPTRPSAKNVVSAGAVDSAAKPKPTVPVRPPSGKLASIKASFMSDLNSRLQLGPQSIKKEEPKEEPAEPAPLVDARKSRARGPARRKPAAAEAASESTAGAAAVTLSISAPLLYFSINENGDLHVGPNAPRSDLARTATNTSVATETEERVALPTEAVGAAGDLPEPTISEGTIEERKEIEPVLQEALASDAAEVEGKHTAPSLETTEQQTQTGQHDIVTTNSRGEQEKVTAFLSGHAPEEGNVVVKPDGTEEVGQITEETPRRVAETGHGM